MKNETTQALESILIILYMFCGALAIGLVLVIVGEISKLFSV